MSGTKGGIFGAASDLREVGVSNIADQQANRLRLAGHQTSGKQVRTITKFPGYLKYAIARILTHAIKSGQSARNSGHIHARFFGDLLQCDSAQKWLQTFLLWRTHRRKSKLFLAETIPLLQLRRKPLLLEVSAAWNGWAVCFDTTHGQLDCLTIRP